ncbi:MAG: DUF2232 domain-containing protein [Gemmatimonadota bacterium]|nr:DUF2232 domain-containing protein [Gemmatimonadota bacterium]MDH3367160.1 DUF2232 domain-containing protein [Gemmatimonadota bacterium]MDH3478628.1 DUF2232 domain-containing protein [Gemmatimonadota bacterium]MDH5548457.1 DUF2232 domain-containing protein [Gemmatimonadota bacterium]
MPLPSERAPQGGLGHLIVGGIAFVLVAPLGLVAIPLAALLLVSHPRSTPEIVVAGTCAGFGLWWLMVPGELPDQVLRAGVISASALYVMATRWTQISFTHRALGAIAVTGAGITGLLAVLGSSWGELQWWVEFRAGQSARQLLGAVSAAGERSRILAPTAAQIETFEQGLSTMTRLVADFFPAISALQLLAGLLLATVAYARLVRQPVGRPAEPFQFFGFTEHLGWIAVGALVVVVTPKLSAAELPAANVLLIVAVLYALRGAAVLAFGLALSGRGGFFLWAAFGVILFLMLPVVVGGAILLGVLDAGLNLRRRWLSAANG